VVPSKNPETDIDAAHLGVCASGGAFEVGAAAVEPVLDFLVDRHRCDLR
jgi:hypothetical protein